MSQAERDINRKKKVIYRTLETKDVSKHADTLELQGKYAAI
jgi:hypothetical protein